MLPQILLSQAEHDEWQARFLVTEVWNLAEKVSEQTELFYQSIITGRDYQKSLDNYGHILVADTMDEAIDAANEIASEHLEIMTASPFEVMTKDPKCRRYIYRGKFKRTAWRLFCGTESRSSDKRNCKKIFLSSFCR